MFKFTTLSLLLLGSLASLAFASAATASSAALKASPGLEQLANETTTDPIGPRSPLLAP